MNHHFSLQPADEGLGSPLSTGETASAVALQHRTSPAGSRLFDLGQLDVRWEAPIGALWTYIPPVSRPNFSPAMLRDVQRWHTEIRRESANRAGGLRSLVL